MSRRLPVAPRPLRWAGVLACATVILAASVEEPGPGPPALLLGVSLSVYLHLAAYAGLTGAVGYALLRADHRGLLLAAAVAVCYGLAIELVQAPLPYRTASALDALVNAAGATGGAALWRAIAPLFGATTDVRPDDDGTTSI